MTYISDTYEPGHVAAVDLQRIEDNFEYLRTNFYGSSAPANPGGGLDGVIWADSDSVSLSEKLLKVYLGSWKGILALTKPASGYTGLIWLHDNDTNEADGWGIDTSITEDAVMAIKNHGAGTYTTGRVTAGNTWAISGMQSSAVAESGHTHSHTHLWFKFVGGTNNDHLYDSAGNQVDAGPGAQRDSLLNRYSIAPHGVIADNGGWDIVSFGADRGTDIDATGSSGHTHSHAHTFNGTWRVRAQVGIVIYPDI